MKAFMSEKGYIVHTEVTNPYGLANDFIFVKKDLVKSTNNIDNKWKKIINSLK